MVGPFLDPDEASGHSTVAPVCCRDAEPMSSGSGGVQLEHHAANERAETSLSLR
jgi:hypothetical protein